MPRLHFNHHNPARLPRASTLLATVLLLFASSCLLAQPNADVGVEVLQNDNLGRSFGNGASDTGLAASLVGSYHWQPGLYSSVNLSGSVRKSLWQQYTGMNSLDLAFAAELTHKFGIGELRPVLKAGAQIARQDFHNDVRDAVLGTYWLGLGKRVTGRFSLDLRFMHERSNGDHHVPLPAVTNNWQAPSPSKSGKVWDYSVNALRIGAEYELTANAWLGSAFQFRDGPVVATATVYTQPNRAALASTYDPVFGPHAVAYRLDARSRVFSIDYNHALSGFATVYAGFEYQHSTASSGVDYEVQLLRAGFIHSF